MMDNSAEIEELKNAAHYAPWSVDPQGKLARALVHIERLAKERDFARGEVETLLEHKWSALELALADQEAHALWMKLHKIDTVDGLLVRAEAAERELMAWRECAMYDAMMGGPVFKGWNRSALDRCRRAQEIEARRGETAPAGSIGDESPTPSGDAPG